MESYIICLVKPTHCKCFGLVSLQWRHIVCNGVSNHLPASRLLTQPVSGEFLAQKASNAENVSSWWRLHGVNGDEAGFIQPVRHRHDELSHTSSRIRITGNRKSFQGMSINYLPANSAIRLIKLPLYTRGDFMVFWAGSYDTAGDNFGTTYQISVILVGLMDLTYR